MRETTLVAQNRGMDGVKRVDVAIRSSRRLLRDTLAACLQLQPDLVVVGQVAEVTDLRDLCLLRRPQLLLVDIGVDDTRALESLQSLRSGYPDTRIVIIHETLSTAGLALAQRMRLAALVPFSHGLAALLDVLHEHARRLLAERPAAVPDGRSLTDDERKIIALLAGGYPMQRMAAMLGISAHAVESSKRRIYAKLGVTSPSQVVARAATLGLVDWPASTRADGASGASDVDGSPRHTGRRPQLTAREADILESIAMGHTVRQTARMFGIAEKTVESTQARLFLKLGAHSRAGAIAAAHELGLLKPAGDARRGPTAATPRDGPDAAVPCQQNTLAR